MDAVCPGTVPENELMTIEDGTRSGSRNVVGKFTFHTHDLIVLHLASLEGNVFLEN